MEEPRVFILSEWAKRIEDKLEDIDDKLSDHDHDRYVTTAALLKGIGVVVAIGVSITLALV